MKGTVRRGDDGKTDELAFVAESETDRIVLTYFDRASDHSNLDLCIENCAMLRALMDRRIDRLTRIKEEKINGNTP